MRFEQIEALLEKYYNGETSLQEEAQLKTFFTETQLLPDRLKPHALQFQHYAQEQETQLDQFLADDWLFEKIEQPGVTLQKEVPVEKQNGFFRQYAWQIAASISLLLVAFWAGHFFQQAQVLLPSETSVATTQPHRQGQTEEPTSGQETSPQTEIIASAETPELAAEGPEETVTLAPRRKAGSGMAATPVMRTSASERLQLVRQELETDGLTPQESQKVIRQLVKTMNQDHNVNVRLAACEALYRFKDQPEARKAFIQALGTQTDPMMQVTLIEIVISLKEKTAVPHLQDLSTRDNLLPIVKLKAQEGLGTLI